MNVRRAKLLLACILIFAGGFRLITLNQLFQRDSEGCGAFYGLLARNYFRYDVSQTHGLPIMSMGQGAPPVFYANHPSTTPLLIAGVYAITGYHGQFDTLPGDWQTRLPTAIFTVACVGLIYMLIKRRASERAGLCAAALFATIPMTLVFGGLPDVINPQMLFFVLLTIAVYERFHHRLNWRNLLMLILSFMGAGLMDWPAYYLVPVLGLHFICTRKVRDWPWIIGFGLFSSVLFIALYAHSTMGQDDWRWMIYQFKRRGVSTVTDAAGQFTFKQWYEHAVKGMAIARHTVIVTVLGLLWLPLAAARRFTYGADRMIGLLFGWALLHILLGRQGLYQHEWWWWPVTPALVLGAAVVIDRLLSARLNPLLAGLLLLFAGWNIRSAGLERANAPRITSGELDYTMAEFGQVIRDHTPPDRVAFMSESDMSLAFWSYADRALKRDIWDLPTFQKRLADDTTEISFNKWVTSPALPGSMIIPKTYLVSIKADLLEFLDTRYPRQDLPKFVVYDLTKPK